MGVWQLLHPRLSGREGTAVGPQMRVAYAGTAVRREQWHLGAMRAQLEEPRRFPVLSTFLGDLGQVTPPSKK